MGNQCITPLRSTPVQNSMNATVRMIGIRQDALEQRSVGVGVSLVSPAEASPVSKSSWPAWLGRSLSRPSSIRKNKSEQRSRNREYHPSDAGCRGSRPDALGGLEQQVIDSERQKHAARNHRAEDAGEATALGHVEPVRVHLHDGDGAVALEIHVHGVERAEHQTQRSIGGSPGSDHLMEVHAHHDVRDHGAEGARPACPSCRPYDPPMGR